MLLLEVEIDESSAQLVVGIGLIIIGLGVIGIALFFMEDYFTSKKYKKITGTITRYLSGKVSNKVIDLEATSRIQGDRGTIIAVVEYETEDGDIYSTQKEKAFSGNEIGDKIEVFVNPLDPSENIIIDKWHHINKPKLMMLIGGLCSVVGVFIALT